MIWLIWKWRRYVILKTIKDYGYCSIGLCGAIATAVSFEEKSKFSNWLVCTKHLDSSRYVFPCNKAYYIKRVALLDEYIAFIKDK